MEAFSSTALKVAHDGIWILDQTQLPQKEVWVSSPTPESMVEMIQNLKVRGAPLIGVAAALQLGHLAEQGVGLDRFEGALSALREARPTAVNLMNAMDRMLRAVRDGGLSFAVEEAQNICREDFLLSEEIAKNGATLLRDGDNVLTHCNAGGLVTVGVGTALGVIIRAAQNGKALHVYVDETRPLLQGGRLTTWELSQNQIPYTLICDNMAAYLMQKGKVDRVMVGADRIATNGDFANKVGSYGLAVLCQYHDVPFYVVAPQTTVDANCARGQDIPVEERAAFEVRGARGAFGSFEWSVSDSQVWNPAFDVTPQSLVTAWVMDRGVFTHQDVKNGALVTAPTEH